MNVDGDDVKKVKLSDIVSVNHGRYGKGIVKHVDKIEKARCLLIKYYKDNSTKDMEFVLPDTFDNKEKLLDFATKLENFLNYKKKA